MSATSTFVVGSAPNRDQVAPADLAAGIVPTLARFRGALRLVGSVVPLTGGAPAEFGLVVEFPDPVSAASWYDTTDYAAIHRFLHRPAGELELWLIEPLTTPTSDHQRNRRNQP